MCYIGIPTRMVFKNAHLAASVVAISLTATTLTAQTRQGLQVTPVVRGDYLYVTTELREGLTPDVRAAIDSGLKTIFTFSIELRLDVPGWRDRTIANSVVTNTVDYDNLTGTFTLERRIDGRDKAAKTTRDAAEVRQWMTSLQNLDLFSTRLLQPSREYYVRVNATARPSYGSILWPFGSGTSAQTKFVFLR
jgi:hypothetical protein